MYGDAFGSFSASSPNNNLALPSVQQVLLKRWVQGDFVSDWNPGATAPKSLDEVPIAEQPAVLDKAPLHFCLADAFHPGCEITWPMRHASMYEKPFRIRHRAAGQPKLITALTSLSNRRAAGRATLCPRPRRHQPMDGIAMARRYSFLPIWLRTRIRPLSPYFLASAGSQLGAHRR